MVFEGDLPACASQRRALLPVHLRDELPEGAGFLVREGGKLSAEARLADGADLVDRDLGPPAAYPAAEPGAPAGWSWVVSRQMVAVWRCWFSASRLTITAGRVLATSAPWTGSRETHRIS